MIVVCDAAKPSHAPVHCHVMTMPTKMRRTIVEASRAPELTVNINGHYTW